MTREEEIEKIASAFAIDEVKDTCNPASKRGLLYVGFVTGAQWADQHPHWISVEDELPPVNEAFIAYWNNFVIVQQGRDERFGNNKHITHWMPLPSIEHLKD